MLYCHGQGSLCVIPWKPGSNMTGGVSKFCIALPSYLSMFPALWKHQEHSPPRVHQNLSLHCSQLPPCLYASSTLRDARSFHSRSAGDAEVEQGSIHKHQVREQVLREKSRGWEGANVSGSPTLCPAPASVPYSSLTVPDVRILVPIIKMKEITFSHFLQFVQPAHVKWRFEPTLSDFIVCALGPGWTKNALGTLDSEGPTLHLPHLSRAEWKFSSLHPLYASNSHVYFHWLSTHFFFKSRTTEYFPLEYKMDVSIVKVPRAQTYLTSSLGIHPALHNYQIGYDAIFFLNKLNKTSIG